MRLPLVRSGSADEAAAAPVTRLEPRAATLALVPIDETQTLLFASTILGALAELSAPAHVVVETTSPHATALPTALAVHGAGWSRIRASDTSALATTLDTKRVVLLIGTGLALAVRANLVLAVAGGALTPLISRGLREVRPFLDGTITEARNDLARRLAQRLATSHP